MRKLFAWLGRTIAENLVRVLIGLLLTSSVALILLRGGWAWIVREWTCVHAPWCTVSGESLGLLLLGFLLLVAAVVGLCYVLRHVGADALAVYWFKSFYALDDRYKLGWRVQVSPRLWPRDRATEEIQVQRILDGPFHAVAGCNERLSVDRGGRVESSCGSCRRILFNYRERSTLSEMREAVFNELLRMERDGKRVRGPRVVLQRPRYWDALRPLARDEYPYEEEPDEDE